ncbi:MULTISPECIES: signal peptidase II [Micromonospora]|uniref:Lipoprotein signal peptidase n=1 Tax=Micromonospora solifontis TaxID=2487138 RepID=A0ABX9WJR3_9ACTN|nr:MULTISPECIES: signal peptidase II [Micromonospora]NES12245.1 signal peptidase II [Micromonospora sp. PPF5-17B]NES36952.1 signal peptidase II [Micromonospora solifontis]NES54272.1 signal peptidase II [Micromonospora sp. PPF5-6]RNL98874.1 signal peptidase II [Micromonospora solifontis]
MTAAPPAGSGTAESTGGTPRRKAVGVLLGVAVAALVADLVTKQLALSSLTGRGPVSLLGGAVYLTLTRNSGAAWSIGSDHTWVFPLITVAVIGWIAWMALRLRSLPWAVSLGLVLGGALGNLTDRVFRAPGHFVGHVVDMVSLFDPYGQVWPVFNLADSSLVCGVVLAVFLELTGRQRDGSRATAERSGDALPADQRERA